ncbi:MAG: AMP-binding protein [Actinomycetota bacterium]|nr:AMP-binding protein [Actinomycetota bacterium]
MRPRSLMAGGWTGRAPPDLRPGTALGAGDLWLLNSTSGTTGLPKCVMHSQTHWMYFHQLAVEAGDLTADDIWLSALPGPFGFGIWTAHVTPAILGGCTVLVERFSPDEVLSLIERHRGTSLACVSTQLIMLLNAGQHHDIDLTSLRVMFTGGHGVSKEPWPVRLEVMVSLPRTSSGKVAKGELRQLAHGLTGRQA